MKVMLINSLPQKAASATSDWDTAQEDIGAFPPIGISYIAGYLQAYTDHDVCILDAVAERFDYPQIRERLLEFKPEIVGTTVFTPTFYDNLVLARLVKKVLPECFVCMGGVQHMRMFEKETLSHIAIDLIVRGEGEVIFADLLDALEKGRALSSVEGISFMEDGKVVSPGPEGYIKDINKFPPPAFDALKLDLYKSVIGTGKTVATIATSRGCPYKCTFCDHPYRTFRVYDNDRILSEIEWFYDKGIREFMFFDDMFNINAKRVNDISDAILSAFPDIIWAFRGRADQVTEEMAIKAKKAGCVQMMFGLEATTDEHLKIIKKQITIQKLKDAVKICKKVGIGTSSNYIIGFPFHKTRQDVLDVIDFAISCGSNYAQFNILLPYAGTEIYDEGVERGILPADFWRNYVLNPEPNAYIPIWNEHLSREELSELLKMCYQKFYLRPSKVFENLLRVRSFSQLNMKIKGMFTVMGIKGGYKRGK
jgi:anaerobic magnesium-protoporphyrin IX monomethyl ester cyclase